MLWSTVKSVTSNFEVAKITILKACLRQDYVQQAQNAICNTIFPLFCTKIIENKEFQALYPRWAVNIDDWFQARVRKIFEGFQKVKENQ